MTSNLHHESDIQKCFDHWTDCYNRGDLNGYLEAYADSEHTRYVSGASITIGKKNIKDLVYSRGTKGVLTLHHFQVYMITGHDAICFGQYLLRVKTESNHLPSDHTGCFTVHVRKIESTWKIWSDHSS